MPFKPFGMDENGNFPPRVKSALTKDARKQSALLAAAMRKLRKNQAVKIVARGDSTTYGHDTVSSDKVAADPTVLPDGSTHSATRSPKPWPAALQDCLNTGYGVSNIVVTNQGYSGDYVRRGFSRWTADVDADITILSYGINDASASYVPEDQRGNLDAYLEWTEKMLVRDLDWGSAVVFMTPTRQKGAAGNVDTDSYRNALQSLAYKYGIPIIDGEQFMATQPMDAWSDGNHLSTKGNYVMGARLAAVFLAESPLNPKQVTSGSKLLARPTLDGFVKHPGASLNTSPGYPTPADNVAGAGSAVTIAGNGSHGLWAFYTDQPDMVVFPSVYINAVATDPGASVEFILDFDADAGDDYNDRAVGDGGPDFVSSTNSFILGPVVGGASTAGTLYNDHIKGANPQGLRIPTAGWHTLRTVTTTGNAGSSTAIHNIEFYAHRLWLNTRENVANQATLSTASANALVKGAFLKPEPASYNETTAITQTRVRWPDVVAAVYGASWTADFYKHPPMRITVTSYQGSIMEYLFYSTLRSDIASTDVAAFAVDAAATNGSHKINVLKYLSAIPVAGVAHGTNVNARVLESIAYSSATQELILNWKATLDDGTTARNMTRNFNVAFSVI